MMIIERISPVMMGALRAMLVATPAQHPVRPGTADHGADQRAQVRDDSHDAGLEQGEMLLLDQVVREPGQEEEQCRGIRELADQRSEHALLADELPDVRELRVAAGLTFDVYRRYGTAARFDVLELGLRYPLVTLGAIPDPAEPDEREREAEAAGQVEHRMPPVLRRHPGQQGGGNG